MIVKLIFKNGVVKSYSDVDWFFTYEDEMKEGFFQKMRNR